MQCSIVCATLDCSVPIPFPLTALSASITSALTCMQFNADLCNIVSHYDRLSQQVSGLQQQLVTFQHHVQSELDEGGFRFGPVKSRLQQLLADFAYSSCSDESSLTDRQASDNTRHTMRQLGSEPILDPSDQVRNSCCCICAPQHVCPYLQTGR